MTTTATHAEQPMPPAVSAADVLEWTRRLVDGAVPRADHALVDVLGALEKLKAAACAAQAQAAVDLDVIERDRQAVAGVPTQRRGLGVGSQVGLARRESPHRGRVLLGAAKVWATEMPHTFRALRHGRLSEYQAIQLVQETACLEREDRAEIDALLCADPASLDGLGTRRLVALVRQHAARLDPSAVVKRARKAESERCVTLRPAPDSMTYLTALLPVAQGVAAYAALCRAADLAAAVGDRRGDNATVSSAPPRSRGQVMADTLVERLTGQVRADEVPVTINLVMSDSALLGAGHEAGHLSGGGVIPAQVARELAAAGIATDAAWLRRLYADPTGDLVAMTSRSRFHPDGLADFLRIRDQGICRTPYCGAPIRHIDHIASAGSGGETSASNGEGLCVQCNLVKEAPGWRRERVDVARTSGPPAARHVVVTTTPTGHRYVSEPPAMPVPARHPVSWASGQEPSRVAVGFCSVVDISFRALVAEHELRVA
ncbi:HNH endonuclease [Cellulomonas sp. JH27-2]|uniref:HNH endonuclease n=1 Tax=Cellulomonas sp. JH27-2 TaxID=2774139 RepID=UPI00177D03C4|nr:HNH endonuclease [Cellulomonas sp. JH27-2]MBD8058457.1 HNH endonuclease [Cellulomonas sp. JH27-2]